VDPLVVVQHKIVGILGICKQVTGSGKVTRVMQIFDYSDVVGSCCQPSVSDSSSKLTLKIFKIFEVWLDNTYSRTKVSTTDLQSKSAIDAPYGVSQTLSLCVKH
jgi:hypothetical protein